MMKAGECLDDKVVIPEEIKSMSKEELKKSIKKLEDEIKEEKNKPK